VSFKQNSIALIKLGTPIVLGSIGHLLMHVVDLAFLGRLSADAMGAVGPSIALYSALMMLAIGIMAGLDPLLAQNIGAKRKEVADEYFRQSFIISIGVSLLFTIILFFGGRFIFESFSINPQFIETATKFNQILSLSMIPMIVFQAARQYLQAIGNVKFFMYVMVIGNLVNLLLNPLLIFGWGEVPALGANGSAWSTVITRIVLMILILVYARTKLNHRHLWYKKFQWNKVKKILSLGIPAGVQFFMEVGIFSVTGLFAARLKAEESSAHLIALNLMSVLFMIPLGLANAGAVLVGNHIGAKNIAKAHRVGVHAIIFAALLALATAVLTYLLNPILIGIYTNQPNIIVLIYALLPIGLLFHFFDAIQAVATGVLRGAGETKIPALLNFVAYWVIGAPLGYYLCFVKELRVFGLWWGLAIGLMLISCFLTLYWKKLQIRPVINLPTN
jgi:MATE family multidrug resistance protein